MNVIIHPKVLMALSFVADLYGKKRAQKIAYLMEYIWNDKRHNDQFLGNR